MNKLVRATYTQVPNSEIESQELSYSIASLLIPWSPYLIVTTLSLLLNVVLVIALLRWKDIGGSCRETLYSPVDVGLDNSPTKFQSFYVQNRSVFDMPPSPEVDAAWEALYSHAGIRLTKEEAAKLPNTTWPIHGDPSEGYLGALYVFHELHCLDIIRQTLYASYYNITFDDSIIRYCLSGLRQSVMCSADTSVVVWQWSDAHERAMERTDILHSCKNFTKIQDWVSSRSVNMEGLDLTSHH